MGLVRSVWRICRKYTDLDRQDRRAVVRATVTLLVARAAVAVLPFSTVYRVADNAGTGRRSRGRIDPGRMIWAVKVVGNRLFPRNPCLPQALVVHRHLRRAGTPSELRISVRKGKGGKFGAHAWVESEGSAVIGGEVLPYGFVAFPRLRVEKEE